MHTQKLISIIIVLFGLTGSYIWFANTQEINIDKYNHNIAVQYKRSREIAQQYIDNNIGNEYWKDEPTTLWEWVPMYMEKDIPSYIEYAFLCQRMDWCGSILINLDGEDTPVVMSSKSDVPIYETLIQKSGTSQENLKFYYFSPFSIYAQNIHTHQLTAIDPQIDATEDLFSIRNEKDKEEMLKIMNAQKEELSKIFENQLKSIKEYKQSEAFHKYLEEKNNNIINNFPQSNTWKYVPGNSSSGCNSIVPCYKQYIYRYRDYSFCYSGCKWGTMIEMGNNIF